MTQNKALVNISNFKAIYVDHIEEDDGVVITDGNYILGKYKSDKEAVNVIEWIAEAIGKSNPSESVTIVMPLTGEYQNED